MAKFEPLTGKALLDHMKELGNLSRGELAKACGYYSLTKSGKERVNFTAFYEALLQAKGVNLDESTGKKGRQPGYIVRVQGNGNLLIGAAYTKQLNLQPGDEFEIKLGRKQIKLLPTFYRDQMEDDDED
jgi:hypothetical protein